MRDADNKFAQQIIEWVFNPVRRRPSDALVVCDTRAFADWVMNNIAHPKWAARVSRDRLEGEDGSRIDFMLDDRARRAARGRSYDAIFLVDSISWRTYQAVMPCLSTLS